MLQFAMHTLSHNVRHFKYLVTFFFVYHNVENFLVVQRKGLSISLLCCGCSVGSFKPLVSGQDGLPNYWHADVLLSSVAPMLIMQMGLSSLRKSSDAVSLWDHVTFSYLQCVQDISGMVWPLGASHLPLPLLP